jgi:hypothetical protein
MRLCMTTTKHRISSLGLIEVHSSPFDNLGRFFFDSSNLLDIASSLFRYVHVGSKDPEREVRASTVIYISYLYIINVRVYFHESQDPRKHDAICTQMNDTHQQ